MLDRENRRVLMRVLALTMAAAFAAPHAAVA